jgi:hypothetical protein
MRPAIENEYRSHWFRTGRLRVAGSRLPEAAPAMAGVMGWREKSRPIRTASVGFRHAADDIENRVSAIADRTASI